MLMTGVHAILRTYERSVESLAIRREEAMRVVIAVTIGLAAGAPAFSQTNADQRGTPVIPINRLITSESVVVTETADQAAIRSIALDYIEGWYAGDAARMESALHP